MLINNERQCANGKDIYDFIEWYKLDLDIRADLITVIENVRLGANIELWKLKKEGLKRFSTQKWCLEFCLKRFGLHYRDHKGNYYISRDASWLDRLWSGKIKTGEFLGYPQCCITAFEIGCQRVASSGLQSGPVVQFCRKLQKTADIEKALLYAIHVPCGTTCKKAIQMAAKIKLILKAKDPQAARYLMGHNKNGIYEFHYYYPETGKVKESE